MRQRRLRGVRRVQLAELAGNGTATVLRAGVAMPVAVLTTARIIGRLAMSMALAVPLSWPLALSAAVPTRIAASVTTGIAARVSTTITAGSTATATTSASASASLRVGCGQRQVTARQVDAERHGRHGDRKSGRGSRGNKTFAK
jgi:hypothetical protein